ncbi:hypothetical protein [Streptacidiphilus sp. EB129]|uniref:hypothetical protein n=1 Tax=Streptacidiphilus sp. EB129 TaxID=3156262 RepID=UPI003516FD98
MPSRHTDVLCAHGFRARPQRAGRRSALPTIRASDASAKDAGADGEGAAREGEGDEAAAASADRLPALVAGQLGWVHATLLHFIGQEVVAGRPAGQVARESGELPHQMRALLGDTVPLYAERADRT